MAEHQPKPRQNSKRQDLIEAGLREINENGVAHFSIRRVANACGVSCAAPARHFGDRKGFLEAIIQYVNQTWRTQQLALLEKCQGTTREQLVELSVAYAKFLIDHPHFRSILMLKDKDFDNVYHRISGELSSTTQVLAKRYREETNMPPEVFKRKLYVIRSLIFGASLLVDNGELEYDDNFVNMIRTCIDREFDLP